MSSDNLPVRYTVSDIETMAKQVAQSRLFGMDQAQAFTMMLLAQAKGIHPIQAVERYHVIQGRPAMKADAMLADFQAAGGTVEWTERTNLAWEGIFKHPVHAPKGEAVRFTIEDAKRAELLSNKMWSKYPANMLKARVISNGIRLVMPGIVAGIYSPEEVQDFEPARPVDARVVEPPPPIVPQNNSGYGRGQYASPAQLADYVAWLRQFVEDANQEWLDEWTQDDGELTHGINEYLRTYQVTAHLLKWGLRSNMLADVGLTFDAETGKPVEAVSVSKAEKYVAILLNRHRDDMIAEALTYARDQADAARATWKAKHGPQPEDESQEIESTEAGAHG